MWLPRGLFGDSLVSDVAWWVGFRRRKRIEAVFFRPCWPSLIRWSYDPRFEPYTDGIEWLAKTGEETWLIGERLWHGWPDPPQWAFWALGADDALLCAWDFDNWPKAWERREGDRRCVARAERAGNLESENRC